MYISLSMSGRHCLFGAMSVAPQLIVLNEEVEEGLARLKELGVVEYFQGLFSRHHVEVAHMRSSECTGPVDTQAITTILCTVIHMLF